MLTQLYALPTLSWDCGNWVHVRCTREVKMFSTKTRSDVGMVPCISEKHMCLHEKINWWKNSRNKEGYHSMLTNRGEHSTASRNNYGGVPFHAQQPRWTFCNIIFQRYVTNWLWQVCIHTYLYIHKYIHTYLCNVPAASNVTFHPLLAQLHEGNSLNNIIQPKQTRSTEYNI